MVGVLMMTAVARAESKSCEEHLFEGRYASGSIAQQICERFPMTTIGCAMDMIDMNMETDIFEAIEYCAYPIVRDYQD